MEYQYMSRNILQFLKEQRMAIQAEKEEAELARQMALQEHIYSYPDGNVYMGHMRENTTTDADGGRDCGEQRHSHLRHGRGTLRTPAFVYGIPLKSYTSEEAAENAQFAKWHEYAGTWENDKLHGYGVHVQKSGDGGEIVIFEGTWEYGKPVKPANKSSEWSDDDTHFG